MNPLRRAYQLFGSRARFARELGLTAEAVRKWELKGRIPAERCIDIERATRGAVTVSDLRPDLWPQSGAVDPPRAA